MSLYRATISKSPALRLAVALSLLLVANAGTAAAKTSLFNFMVYRDGSVPVTAGSTVSGPLLLKTIIADPSRAKSVSYYYYHNRKTVLISKITPAKYSPVLTIWNTETLSNGKYTVQAVYEDMGGREYRSNIYFFLNNQVITQCGNGIVEGGEVCDSGSETCTVSGYAGSRSCNSQCSGYNACTTAQRCGDGVVNGTEQCDGTAGVGAHQRCTSSCVLENLTYCGDGSVQNPNSESVAEQCEGSGSRNCTAANGYAGTESCNANTCVYNSCVATERCGDGVRNGTEECDGSALAGQTCATRGFDGGTLTCANCGFDISGCFNNPTSSLTITQPANNASVSGWVPVQAQYTGTNYVGAQVLLDNVFQMGTSQNPISKNLNFSAVSNGPHVITIIAYANGGVELLRQSVTVHVNTTPTGPVCGNGTVETGEQCDGENLNGQTCTSRGFDGGGLSCSNCMFYTSGCFNNSSAVCGNNVVESGEICDGNFRNCTTSSGYSGTQVCNAQCAAFGACVSNQYCGDNVRNGNESCDEGILNGQAGHCNAQCSGITPPVCGNTVVESGEQCDDGNTASGDGCSSVCTNESSGGGGSGVNMDIRPVIENNRTSGVAPLAVHFDASATTALNVARPFHDLSYEWNFGDPQSGVWSTTGHSKNISRSPVTGHVYDPQSFPDDCNGTPCRRYTAQLRVSNDSGYRTADVAVEVYDPNRIYTGGNTYCYANGVNPDFTGCPSGAVRVPNISSFNSALGSNVPSNTRHLFKRGDTFSLSMYANSRTGILIGAFGTGPKPVFQASLAAGDIQNIIHLNDNSTLMDIHINGGGGGTMVVARDASVSNDADNVLLYRTDMERVTACIGSWDNNTVQTANSFASGNAFVDINCTIEAGASITGYTLGYFQSDKLMIMGFNLDSNGALLARTMRSVHLRKSVLQYNVIRTPENPQITIRACGGRTNPVRCPVGIEVPDEYNSISDNEFVVDGGNSNWFIWCNNDECDTDGLYGNPTRNHLIERNHFRIGTPNTVDLQRIFDMRGSNLTVRDNVIDLTNARIPSWGSASILQTASFGALENGQVPNKDRNNLIRNTIVAVTPSTGIRLHNNLESTSSGHEIKDNLVYTPGSPVAISNGPNISAENNLIYGTNYNVYPFVTPYTTPSQMSMENFEYVTAVQQLIQP